MTSNICIRCQNNFNEIIRGYCRKCYYALKYKKELFNVEKPDINSFSSIQEEMLIGSLLGDANLHRNSTSKFAHLKIERSSKDLEYLQYQFNILKPLCKSGCKTYVRKDGSGNNSYFITRSYKILDDLYRKWYPNGKKIVPRDIKLTPLMVAIWICDDGHICLVNKKYSSLRINFATNGFILSDVEYLRDLLYDKYNQNFKINKTSINNQYVINGSNGATLEIIKDIKNVFPQSMYRKLKCLNI